MATLWLSSCRHVETLARSAVRGNGGGAVARKGIASRDEQTRTAHDLAAQTQDREQLPDRVRRLTARRTQAVARRQKAYRHWCEGIAEEVLERHQWIEQHRDHSRDHSIDYGLEL